MRYQNSEKLPPPHVRPTLRIRHRSGSVGLGTRLVASQAHVRFGSKATVPAFFGDVGLPLKADIRRLGCAGSCTAAKRCHKMYWRRLDDHERVIAIAAVICPQDVAYGPRGRAGAAKGWTRENGLAAWIGSPSSVLGQPQISHLKQCKAGARPAATGMLRTCFIEPSHTTHGEVVGV